MPTDNQCARCGAGVPLLERVVDGETTLFCPEHAYAGRRPGDDYERAGFSPEAHGGRE